eukprot:TRINITY_DN24104_c0_g1_i1.p1 TRINITY_DN24104_c0_g1~~TRINITY_DN24104_c0_g1_i1.p1  ORF type:complete len:284 (-),score=84.36 TRINITY_DN24104_c0_g1_i1:116-901(-)
MASGGQHVLLASLAARRGALSATKDSTDDRKTGKRLKDGSTEKSEKASAMIKKKPKIEKKAKKGAPQEVSSRRPVAPPQGAVAQAGAKAAAGRARDPRFDDFSGKLDLDAFQKSYGFLEEYRQEELNDMMQEQKKMDRLKRKKRVKGGVDPEAVAAAAAERSQELHAQIKRQRAQDKQRRHLGDMQSAEREMKSQEREKVRSTGKIPYFHNKGDVRKLVMEKKKQAQRGGNGRSKDEERREKKVAAREKKRLPARRNKEME